MIFTGVKLPDVLRPLDSDSTAYERLLGGGAEAHGLPGVGPELGLLILDVERLKWLTNLLLDQSLVGVLLVVDLVFAGDLADD